MVSWKTHGLELSPYLIRVWSGVEPHQIKHIKHRCLKTVRSIMHIRHLLGYKQHWQNLLWCIVGFHDRTDYFTKIECEWGVISVIWLDEYWEREMSCVHVLKGRQMSSQRELDLICLEENQQRCNRIYVLPLPSSFWWPTTTKKPTEFDLRCFLMHVLSFLYLWNTRSFI